MIRQSTFSFYAIVPDRTHRKVLALPGDEGWTLPRCEFQSPHGIGLLHVTSLNIAVREQLGVGVTTFYSIRCYDTASAGEVQFSVFENHSPHWKPPPGARWIDRSALRSLPFDAPLQRSVLESWFEEAAERQSSGTPLLPWWQPGWFEEVTFWIEAQLHRLGRRAIAPVEQRRSWYRSAVLRVRTDAGYVYFKAVTEPLRREVPVTQFLTGWRPSQSPILLAADQERSWMLTQDMGDLSLEDSVELPIWEEALRVYAHLQIASLERIDDLLRASCQDLRWERLMQEIEVLPSQAPRLLQGQPDGLTRAELEALPSLIPRLRRVATEAASYRVPCTLSHGDLGASNVQITPRGYVFYDWSDASIAHPFFDLATFLDDTETIYEIPGTIERLREVYLAEWAAFEPLDRCQELFERLKPLWLFHMEHARLLTAWHQKLGSRPLLPYTATEWSVRSEQRALAVQLQKLLPW